MANTWEETFIETYQNARLFFVSIQDLCLLHYFDGTPFIVFSYTMLAFSTNYCNNAIIIFAMFRALGSFTLVNTFEDLSFAHQVFFCESAHIIFH